MKTVEEIDNFIGSNIFVLFYISTTDCNVCKVLKPKVKDLLTDFPKIESKFIMIDKMPAASGKFSVFAVPTIICYIEGKEFIRLGRNFHLAELQEKISRYYEMIF